MNQLIVFCAKYLLILSLVLVAIFWLRLDSDNKKRFAVEAIVGGLLALLLAKIASHLISDPRPFISGHFTPLIPHANDNGFPSDHALITSFLAFLVWPFSRRVSLALLVIALTVSSARVAAGIHHPIDILGSFIIAAGAVLIVNELWKWWARRHKPTS
ncbi:phosphatase PAP2 family protein [Candidatus Saccharibacteria bacterium]|nr:phosphatase PAP2 family protein [Candidatus Saccharibacteria bacterium]